MLATADFELVQQFHNATETANAVSTCAAQPQQTK